MVVDSQRVVLNLFGHDVCIVLCASPVVQGATEGAWERWENLGHFREFGTFQFQSVTVRG